MSLSKADDRRRHQANVDHKSQQIKELKKLTKLLTAWKQKYSTDIHRFRIDANFEKAVKAIQEIEEKETNKTLSVAVVGGTSCGKSLLLNILIGINILRSGNSQTTPCPVRIHVIHETEDVTAYYITSPQRERKKVDFSSDEERLEFQNLVDKVSGQQVNTYIDLFLPTSLIGSDTVLSTNCTLLDTPGLDDEGFKTRETQKMVKEADVLIMAIDVTTGGNNEQMVKLLYDEGYIVSPNVLLVCNKCDNLDDEDPPVRQSDIIKKTNNMVVDFFTKNNGPYKSKEMARNAIFYVSCKEVSKAIKEEKGTRELCESHGYIETGKGLFTDMASRAAGFRSFEKSLRSLVEMQREVKKTERILSATVKHKHGLISMAQAVGEDLLVLSTVLETLNAPPDDHETKTHFVDLMRKFYDTVAEDGVCKIDGNELINHFFDFISKEDNENEILSFFEWSVIFPSQSEEKDRLTPFVNEALKRAVKDAVNCVRLTFVEEYGQHLKPISFEEHEDIMKKFDSMEESILTDERFDGDELNAMRNKIENMKLQDMQNAANRESRIKRLELANAVSVGASAISTGSSLLGGAANTTTTVTKSVTAVFKAQQSVRCLPTASSGLKMVKGIAGGGQRALMGVLRQTTVTETKAATFAAPGALGIAAVAAVAAAIGIGYWFGKRNDAEQKEQIKRYKEELMKLEELGRQHNETDEKRIQQLRRIQELNGLRNHAENAFRDKMKQQRKEHLAVLLIMMGKFIRCIFDELVTSLEKKSLDLNQMRDKLSRLISDPNQ